MAQFMCRKRECLAVYSVERKNNDRLLAVLTTNNNTKHTDILASCIEASATTVHQNINIWIQGCIRHILNYTEYNK